MADGSVNIGIKINADDSGAKKAEASLKGVAATAKKSAASTAGDLDRVQASVGKISGAFGALKNALTGFGIGAVVGSIFGSVNRITESFGASKKAAEDFAAIQAKLAQEKGIASLATDYSKMSDAIAKAADAQNHALEMLDLEVAGRRRLANAKMNAAKEDEMAALDASAKDYAEQLDRVEKKYAAIKASQDAGNAAEDLVLSRQKMNAKADQYDQQAAAQDKATSAIDAQIRQAKREKSKAEIDAQSINESDKSGVVDAIGKTLMQLFSGDWGRMSGATTAEGDAARREAAQEAAEAEKKIQQLEEQKRQSEEKAAALRTEAAQTRERADALGIQLDAADIERHAARAAGARGEASAQEALDRNHAAQEAEAAKIADARRAAALLAQQQAQIKAQIADRQGDKDAANLAVWQAQTAASAASAGGTRRDQAAAQSNLAAARATAQSVAATADGAIAALTATLKSVEARLKAAQSAIDAQSQRQRYAWSEAPAGE